MGEKEPGDAGRGPLARGLATLRRRRLPAWLAAQLADSVVEAPVLSWAPLIRQAQNSLTDDGPLQGLVATRLGLLRGSELGGVPLVVLWHEVDKATWETPALGLELADGAGLTFWVDDPGNLPRDVRTRVEQSIAWTSHHRLVGRGGVRVVARRPSTGGELEWRLVADAGTDLTDPTMRAEAEQHLIAARSAVG